MIGRRPDGCELLSEWNGRAYARTVPFNVTLELTLRCNLRCTHCYNFDRDEPRPASGAELSLDEIRVLLDDLRRAGTLFLTLTGGEATAHPGFWAVMEEAAARRFAVTLLTNGTTLDAASCDRLATFRNLWGVNLSVYGASAETHDATTQSAGSFRRTMEGAARLRARGVRVALKFIVLRANAHETGQVLERAEREGFEISVDPTVTGRYDGTEGSLDDRVDLETLGELYRGPLRSLVGEGDPEPSDDEFKCNCARGNAAVSSTGEVYPCIATPLRAGNIREQSFVEIWTHSPVFQKIRGLKVADFHACAPCTLKAYCRRSPGPAYLRTGDYTGIDPWTCGEAEIIKDVFQQGR